mgnify:CR=1 FL=1
MFEKKKEEKELIKRLDKINYTLSQNNILELIELLGNRKKFFFRNFWNYQRHWYRNRFYYINSYIISSLTKNSCSKSSCNK